MELTSRCLESNLDRYDHATLKHCLEMVEQIPAIKELQQKCSEKLYIEDIFSDTELTGLTIEIKEIIHKMYHQNHVFDVVETVNALVHIRFESFKMRYYHNSI